LIRQLGAAQKPPKSVHPPDSANAVAAHLIQVAMAARNKKFECLICIQGQSILQQATDNRLPNPFTPEEISAAMQKAKPTASGYDQIHIEVLKNLGPKAHVWLSSSSPGSRQFLPFKKCGERPKRLLWTKLVRI